MGRSFESKEIELMDSCIEICSKVLDALKAIRSGEKSMRRACRDFEFDYMRFRRYLELIYKIKNANMEFPENALDMCLPAEKFYADVFAVNEDEVSSVMPKDADETMDYLLSKLPEKEQNVVRWIYYDGLSYRSIGKMMGISYERVRMIKNDVIRQMRHPKRQIVLKNGIAECTKEKPEDKDVKFDDIGRLIFENYKNGLNTETQLSVPDNTSIDILGLSRRAYNALRNAKIKTVGDLKMYTAKDILGIQNVGIGTLCELVAKASMFGIFFVGID